jgi:hypothetical protein
MSQKRKLTKAHKSAVPVKAPKPAVPVKRGLRGAINGHAYCMLDATEHATAKPKEVAELLNLIARVKEVHAQAWAARKNDANDSYAKIENLNGIKFADLPPHYRGHAALLEKIVGTLIQHSGTDVKLHISANADLIYTTSEHNDSAAKCVQVVTVVLK